MNSKLSAPASAVARDLLAEKVWDIATGSVTFSGLDLSEYSHLEFEGFLKSTTQDIKLYINGHLSTNDYVMGGSYSSTIFLGASVAYGCCTKGFIGLTPAGYLAFGLFAAAGSNGIFTSTALAGGARYDAPVTTLTLYVTSGSIEIGTEFRIYGVKK